MIVDDVHTIAIERRFDIVLVDAPCSATGVIRRNPDIKLLKTSSEISKINKLQMEIIEVLWGLLKNNGLLLYVTCSILKNENCNLIKTLIQIIIFIL